MLRMPDVVDRFRLRERVLRDVAPRERVCAALRDPGIPFAPEGVPALSALAAREGVAGLLPGGDPTLAAARAGARFASIKAGQLTRRAVDALEARAIPCAVLKGAAAAARGWEDPSVRPQGDVDLLVARADFRAALEVLVCAGLAATPTIAGEHYHHALLPPAPGGATSIELHHALSSNLPLRVSVVELLVRRVTVQTGFGPLPALALEDDAAYLGLHAANHALERLSWLVDLAGLASRQRVDWKEAAGRARAWRAALPVWVAWSAAREWLGAAIPDSAIEALGVSRFRRHTAKWLVEAAGRTRDPVSRTLARLFRAWLLPDVWSAPGALALKLRARTEERKSGTGVEIEENR